MDPEILSVTKFEVSPDGKLIGFFVSKDNQPAGVIPFDLNNIIASLPTLMHIKESLNKKSELKTNNVNNGQPLKVLKVSIPQNETFTFICENNLGERHDIRFLLSDSHKMISGLQKICALDSSQYAPIPINSFSIKWDWPDRPEEFVGVVLTGSDGINHSFLLDIQQAKSLAQHLSGSPADGMLAIN